MIRKLRGKYSGQTAWIVGRGASLLHISRADFGPGPVIVLNEAIINIDYLNLPNDIFSLWRNGDVLPDLPKYGVNIVLCDDPVLDHPPSSSLFPDYPLRYTFGCLKHLHCKPAATFSMKAALEIAVHIFGCASVSFVSFDSCTTGDIRTALRSGIVQSEYKPGAYNEQCEIIRNRIRELNLPVDWITPAGEKDSRPVRLNIGCGEVLEPCYVNIDLHHPGADIKMDARYLNYKDESVDEICSSHLLEHFGKREVPIVLREWFRALKVGGVLKMEVPNLEWCMRNWLEKNEKDRFGISLDMIYGLQTNEGEFHKTGFTKQRLHELLSTAGFQDISIEDKKSHAQTGFFITAEKNKGRIKTIGDRIAVVTCTGDRPLAFALCNLWMQKQTRQPDQWIVVDDGKVPLMPTEKMEYIRREPRPDDPKHTMLLNLQEAIPRITGDKVIIIEDDEYYAPEYVAEMARRLDDHEVVGICRSKYYHFATGSYSIYRNMDHASFAQTAFRASFLPELMTLMNGDVFIDMRIWKLVGKTNKLRWGEPNCTAPEREVGGGRGLLFDDRDRYLYVAMKAMPGRFGSSSGHVAGNGDYQPDSPDRAVLQKWTRDAFKYYLAIMNGKLSNEQCDPSAIREL